MEKQSQSTKTSLDFLGTSWLLHPQNRVRRLPLEDSTPILSKGTIKMKNLEGVLEVVELIESSAFAECKISGRVLEIQDSIKILNAIESNTISGCFFDVETDTTTIYITNRESLKQSHQKLLYLVKTQYTPNQKYSIVTDDISGWLSVFRALALIKSVKDIDIDYRENRIAVN